MRSGYTFTAVRKKTLDMSVNKKATMVLNCLFLLWTHIFGVQDLWKYIDFSFSGFMLNLVCTRMWYRLSRLNPSLGDPSINLFQVDQLSTAQAQLWPAADQYVLSYCNFSFSILMQILLLVRTYYSCMHIGAIHIFSFVRTSMTFSSALVISIAGD